MEYNTSRVQLIVPEYGRNVQKMINHISDLPTVELRTGAANAVIIVMGLLNPQIKEQADYKHKLWDQLFTIAGNDLDVECPFPRPVPKDELPKPARPMYSVNHIRYRHYGKNVELMLKSAASMPDTPAKEHFLNALASYMKMAHRVWNEDRVPDEVILNNIKELSDGAIDLKGFTEFAVHSESFVPKVKKDYNNKPQQKNYGQKNNNSNNNQNRNKKKF